MAYTQPTIRFFDHFVSGKKAVWYMVKANPVASVKFLGLSKEKKIPFKGSRTTFIFLYFADCSFPCFMYYGWMAWGGIWSTLEAVF